MVVVVGPLCLPAHTSQLRSSDLKDGSAPGGINGSLSYPENPSIRRWCVEGEVPANRRSWVAVPGRVPVPTRGRFLAIPSRWKSLRAGNNVWRACRPISVTRAAPSNTRWRRLSLSPCRGAWSTRRGHLQPEL